MEIAERTVIVKAPAQAAWDKLVDWKTMHEWDTFMDWIRFDGDIKMGSKGRLKMRDGAEVDIVVTSFDAPKQYTDEFKMFGLHMIFHHEVNSRPDGDTAVRIAIEAKGPVGMLLAPMMKAQMKEKLPVLMAKYKRQLEEKS
jgi:hypothetical protein